MKVPAVLVIGLAALVPAQAPAQRGMPSENSFFRGDQCPVPDTHPSSSATNVGVDSPSPPSRRAAATVAGFLTALRRGDARRLRRWSANPSAGTAPECLTGLRRLAETCRPEAPYLLDNGSIRVGWVCNGLLSYSSFFVVSGGRIADVDGDDATQPVAVIVAPPSRPPSGGRR